MAEKYGDLLAQKVAGRIGPFVAAEADLEDIPPGMSDNGKVVVALSEQTPWIYKAASTTAAGTYVKVPTDGRSPGRWHRLDATLAASVAGLASDVPGLTCLEGDVVGDWVYLSAASTVALADADDAAKIPALGVIVSKQSTTSCTVRVSGLVTGLSGLTAAAVYYLSTTAGDITATAPAAPNAVPVAIAVSTTALVVLPAGPMFQYLRSTGKLNGTKTISLGLGDFRVVTSGGDVGDIAAIGGHLASDTTPILRGDANGSWEISWAADDVSPVGVQVTLPPDFDDTANATVDFVVYSGATDAATLGLASSWNGGTEVTDSADDAGTKSATRHTITATIAHGDIPAGATHVTFRITPPAHASDAIQLTGVRVNYTPKAV